MTLKVYGNEDNQILRLKYVGCQTLNYTEMKLVTMVKEKFDLYQILSVFYYFLTVLLEQADQKQLMKVENALSILAIAATAFVSTIQY